MKVYKFRLVGLFILFAINYNALGQNITDSYNQVSTSNKSYFSASINFISDAVYMGRKDSISAPYLFPRFTYHHKTGLYATGSLSYLTKSDEGRVDLFLTTLGYDFTVKKLSGDLSITKYFFNDESYNVISEVEADITANASYDFDILDASLSLVTFLNKGSSSDFFLSTEVSHSFLSQSRNFQVSPTIGVFFGSQNFYEEYYISNRYGGAKNKGPGQGMGGNTTVVESVVLNESESFGLMAIEFSLPMWYVSKSFIFIGMPVFAIPQNPSTVTIDSTVYEEDLENTFYWMVGVNYRF